MSKRRSQGTAPRRRAPSRSRRKRGGILGDPHVGPLLRRIGELGLGWEDVAEDVLPVFERARPFTYGIEPPAQAVVPPGVTVGFGIDLGLAFARVGVATLEAWPVDVDGLTERALHNLRRVARHARDYDLVTEPVGGVMTTVFQSRDGWASTAVLVPEAIGRVFGADPALLIAPSRDLLVALPVDVDIEFATWLAEEFESEDPNALRLEAFEWRDGTVHCRPLAREAVAV